MAISRVGGDTFEFNPGNIGDVTFPATINAGDIAFLSVHWYEDGDVTPTTPTGGGWTVAQASTAFGGSGGNEDRLAVWYKHLAGTEDGATQAVSMSGSTFGNWILDVYRATGAITFASATPGTPGAGTTATAPSVSGTSGQGLIVLYGTSDPATMTTPSGMAAGTVGDQNTETGRYFYETLGSTGATGAKSSTLGTSRSYLGVSMLVDVAAGGDVATTPTGVASTTSSGTITAYGRPPPPFTNTTVTG